MKTRSLFLRIAAVVSSLTLFVLFVYDRAGGGSGGFLPQPTQSTAPNANRNAPSAPRTANLKPVPRPNERDAESVPNPRTALFAGSKSMPLATSVEQGKLVLETPPFAPSVDESAREATTRVSESAHPTHPRKTLFAGSKSSLVIDPADIDVVVVENPLTAPDETANAGNVTANPHETVPQSRPRTVLLPGSKTWDPTTTISPEAGGSVPAPVLSVQPKPIAPPPASAATLEPAISDNKSLIGTLPRQQVGALASTKTVVAPAVTKPLNNGKPVERREMLMPGSKAPAGTLFNGKQPFVESK